MFYIEKDNRIVLAYEKKSDLENALLVCFEYAGLEIKETDRPIINCQFADTEEYAQEQKKKEEERIDNLTMTALDFINVIKQMGLNDKQIENYLNANLAVKHQLQFCQNVYCGVAKQLMPITVDDVTITADMVEIAFKIKNNEEIE